MRSFSLGLFVPSMLFLLNAHGQEILSSYIVTFRPSVASRTSPVLSPDEAIARNLVRINPAFGEPSTGQSKVALAADLKISGHVLGIFDRINAAHVMVSPDEAARLKKDPRVLSVQPDRLMKLQAATVQVSPGWGLDRMDQPYASLDNSYTYSSDGGSQTIYVLDTGLNVNNALLKSEFGGRASIVYDVNAGGVGADRNGHGTMVASIAAGRRYGIAKNANIAVAKITQGCTGNSAISTLVMAFNWLASNAPKGTVVNLSSGLRDEYGQCAPVIDTALEASIRAAYKAGAVVVVAAGNDACNAADYSPTRQQEAFVVGATNSQRFFWAQDAMTSFSRYGSTLAGFAPGQDVAAMDANGLPVTTSGTSFATPYVAGLFATGCQALGKACQSVSDAGGLYQRIKSQSVSGTVVAPDGGLLPRGTPSRMVVRNGW